MNRYITEYRWATGKAYPAPSVYDWQSPEQALPDDLAGVFQSIRHYHDAYTEGRHIQPADKQGVFRCTRFSAEEGTCRDVTEDVLEAFRVDELDRTGEEPRWLRTTTDRDDDFWKFEEDAA